MTSEIEDLQIRLVFQEDLTENLSQRIAEQQDEIDKLHSQVNFLNNKLKELVQVMPSVSDSGDEKPPHY